MTTASDTIGRRFFIAAVILSIISFGILAVSYQVMHPTTAGDDFAGLAVGAPVRNGLAEVTVVSVTKSPGSEHYTAPAGKHYEIVTLSVHNVSDKPIVVTPANDTYLKAQNGDTVYLTPTSLDAPFHSGTILPGEKTSGQLSYLVRDDQNYAFYVESDWSGGVMKFLIH